MNYCNKCGSKLAIDAKYCSKCGSKLGATQNGELTQGSIKEQKRDYQKINSIEQSEFTKTNEFMEVQTEQRILEKKSKRNSIIVQSIIGLFVISLIFLIPTLFRSPKEIVFTNVINSLYVNEEYRINILTDIERYDTSQFSWSSSDQSVATVSNGVIKGISEGTTVISVSNGKKLSNQFELSVKYNPVVELSTSLSNILIVGDSTPFIIEILPHNASNKTLIFTSSDESQHQNYILSFQHSFF